MSEETFVQVSFHRIPKGTLYTYATNLDLEPGDVVAVPSPRGGWNRAYVQKVGVPMPDFICKEIIRKIEEEPDA